MMDNAYRMVIGLEVHVQLKTQSKLFCGCSVQFGAEPNTQTCPVCLGLPGALPVINAHALDLSIRTGLALHGTIPALTKWDRKNYFYPDLPKGYQISQFDLPISGGGYVEIRNEKKNIEAKRVGIIRAHLEEDAGKSMHDETGGTSRSKIDLNRTGTPLLEIVSQPEMNSPAEAREYLNELKLLLTYLDVSDCNMQEGSLRVDANVNLHLDVNGQTAATPIVEVKNMNSFRAVERALAYEGPRQFEAWKQTGQLIGDVPKQTHGWDDQAQQTYVQRTKEESSDYRYFPDPDLVPLRISSEWIERIRDALPDTPAATRERLKTTYDLSTYDADVLVNQGIALVRYFETVAQASQDPKRSANWVQQEVMRWLNENQTEIDRFPIDTNNLATLIKEVAAGKLDNARAKNTFQTMVDRAVDFTQAKSILGISEVDDAELDTLCRMLIEQNPGAVEDLRAGKQQAIGALIGQARKQNSNVNPGVVRSKILELLGL